MKGHTGFLAATVLALTLAAPAAAQEPQPAALATVSDAAFAAAWQRAKLTFDSELRAATDPKARQAAFKRLLEHLFADDELAEHRDSPAYRDSLRLLVNQLPESKLANATGVPQSSPGSLRLLERSGLTELVSIASDFEKFFSADGSAISLNLNAVALFGGGQAGDRSAPYLYAKREGWRRLGGTVTVGAKVPEKAISGLSGLPDSDTLFDAISWDVKLRVLGDRDPRAARWYPLLLGSMGQQVELSARIVSLPSVEAADIPLVTAALKELLGSSLAQAKDRIADSLQLSVKATGAHLTKTSGKNKYTFAAMLDKGFGALDYTANASYSVADAMDPAAGAFRTKQLQLTSGLTGSALDNVFEQDRAVELTASARLDMLFDRVGLAATRKNTFHVNLSVSIPFQLKGAIPLSVTWSNDPNNLKKTKQVSAQLGFTYDFGALMGALKK